jgi:ryanodine receptor 2
LPELTERLARNIHDHWVRQRLGEGWTHGAARDDSGKKYPCLVPFEILLEAEKKSGRIITTEGLKATVALGYRIETPRASLDATQAESSPVDRERERHLRISRDVYLQAFELRYGSWTGINAAR